MTDSFTITWDELSKIKPLGLKLGVPVIAEDQQGNLIEISYPILTITGAAMDALKSKKPKLTVVLESMLDAAKAHPGTVQRKSLTSGMSIDLIIGLDGMLRMQLYREKGVYPSDVEWKTTLKYFPVQLEERNPERFIVNNKGYLRAAWEMPKNG